MSFFSAVLGEGDRRGSALLMKIIDRYIATRTIAGILLVLSLLVVLISFMEFLFQLNDIGKGNYQLADAFFYVILTLAKRMVDLLPISILLGSIISLGLLADRFELIAMQSSGISAQRICWAVLAAGVLLMLAGFMVANFIAPPLDQQASILRSKAIYGKGFMVTKSGFWTRHDRSFVHVGRSISRGVTADLELYEYDAQGRLERFVYARQAVISENNQWLLKDVEEKIFSAQGIATRRTQNLTLESFLSAQQVDILELPPDSLSLSDLYDYVNGLEERGQNAERYKLSFWQKISLPLANLAMMLLGLTFIFGYRRDITVGTRIAAASMLGIVLYLMNQIISHVGLLLNVHPAFTTVGPILVIFGFTILPLRRLR